MPTKAELKQKPIKTKLRKGDKVIITTGKDKGQIGFLAAVSPKEQKVIVLQDNPENAEQPIPLNAVIKHKKAKFQNEKSSRMKIPAPLHISNVQLINPKTNKPTRVGRRVEDGKIVRYAKGSGELVADVNLADRK